MLCNGQNKAESKKHIGHDSCSVCTNIKSCLVPFFDAVNNFLILVFIPTHIAFHSNFNLICMHILKDYIYTSCSPTKVYGNIHRRFISC